MRNLNSNFYIRIIFATLVAFTTLLTQSFVFAQSDPDFWIDPINVTARPYRPPNGFGIFPTGGGSSGPGESGGSSEEARIMKLVCTRGQAAYNQAGCAAKPQNPSGINAAVDSAVSPYSYSPLFAASVQRFAQSVWQPSPGSTLRTLIGDGIRAGANSCRLTSDDKPIATCVNQVLNFYGVNAVWTPLGELNGVNLNEVVNGFFERSYNPNNSPVAGIVSQFNLGSFCQTMRDIATENGCNIK